MGFGWIVIEVEVPSNVEDVPKNVLTHSQLSCSSLGVTMCWRPKRGKWNMYWGAQKAHTDNNAFQGYFTQETTRWAPTINGITVNGIITLINGQPYLELGEVPPCTATKKEHWKQLLILISPVFPGDWRMVKSIEIQFFFTESYRILLCECLHIGLQMIEFHPF